MGKSSKNSQALGSFLVSLSAILWATDALFRLPSVNRLDPTFIVAIEHLIGTLILIPVMFWKHRDSWLPSKASHGLGVLLIGAGGSALATIFFTASFKLINPSVAILIQKLQPVAVVLLAMIFLRERPTRGFFIWSGVTLMAAVVLSFPTLDFSFITHGEFNPEARGTVYALSAAILWAVATVAGKALLSEVHPTVTTFWRYGAALITLGVLLLLAGLSTNSTETWSGLNLLLQENSLILAIFYMSLGPGLLALLFYYNGLARTPAMIATFAELLFPFAAVILNAIFLDTPLSSVQILAGLVLIYSVTKVNKAI